MTLSAADQAGTRAPSPSGGHSCEAAELPPCPAAFAEAERRLLRRCGQLAELPSTRRYVLAVMLRLAVQWRDADAWFVLSFKRIARELGCSYSTVNVHVQALKVDGWIERERDLEGARRNGMPIGRTRLTAQALAALGLAQHAQSAGHACRDFKEKSPSESNALEAPSVNKAPENKPAAPSREPCVIAPDGSRIPQDLAPLLEAMSGRQLCGVMKLAGPLGVRVQHIAARALSAIFGAERPVAYLRCLVLSGQDWTALRPVCHKTAAPVSIKSRNTLAGEREDREREREAAEHRAQRSKPQLEHLQVFAALKSAFTLRRPQAEG